jgi:zinc transport system substrate-binding protein
MLAVSLAGMVGCSQGTAGTGTGTQINVTATFYPLFEAARQVGGDKATVANLTPAGVEPHDFEPSAQDIARLSKAKIVVYNGAGLEAWIDRVLPDLNKAGVVIVNASQSAQLLQIADEDDPSKMVNDPHFWLDPVIMQQITLNIKDAFVQADPANKAFYEANAASYNAQLEALNKEFKSGLEQYARRKIITSHDAFAYLSQRYNLDNIFIAGLTPEEEPSPQQLAEISEVAKEEGIKYVFFETLVSPRLAEVVAKEAGAQTMVLNPLEGLTDEEIAAGKTYITVMRENLDNLKTALSAQQ